MPDNENGDDKKNIPPHEQDDSNNCANHEPTSSNAQNTTCEDELSKKLQQFVPQNVTLDFDECPTYDATQSKIATENDKFQLAVIGAYTDNEKARVRRQRWLFFVLVIFTGAQLWFFNKVINTTVSSSFEIILQYEQFDLLTNLFDILKFYIGATVVELIGMIATVTAGTFSSSHVKTMNMLLKNSKDKKELVKDE